MFHPLAWIVQGRYELEVAPVCCLEEVGKDVEAVHGLFHGSDFPHSLSFPSLNFSKVLELRDVARHGFDPEYDPELVVHLD